MAALCRGAYHLRSTPATPGCRYGVPLEVSGMGRRQITGYWCLLFLVSCVIGEITRTMTRADPHRVQEIGVSVTLATVFACLAWRGRHARRR